MIKKLVVEAIGTFFLVFTIGMTVLEPNNAGLLAPFAMAAALMVMVYAGAHISGAHYNPAVTLGVFIRGKCTIHELVGYTVFQLVASALAANVVVFLKGGGPLMQMTIDVLPVLVAEFLFTVALVFVWLNVATTRGTEGNSYFGLAIGGTVLGGVYAVGPISGAAFNPAVTLGNLVEGGLALADVWVFLLPQLLAGATAALLFNALGLDDDKPTTATPEDQDRLMPAGEPGA